MFKKLVCVIVSLWVFSTVSCGGKGQESAASMEQLHVENGRPVGVRKLETEEFSVFLKYSTVIYARSESTAYAGLSDVVRRISAKVGDRVKQDDVIVSFSPDNQSLRQATLAHENALSAFNRSSALFKNNDIARQDFDTVRMQYEIARANLKAANDMVYVKAPITGTITQINVRPTENMRPGAPLFTVSNQNGFEARFYVGADEIERIKTGARVYISESTQHLEGRITQVSLTMDSQRQAFPVTAFFDVETRRIFSGMGVDIAVEIYRNEKAIVLSRKELVETSLGYAAFLANGNTARQVDVQTGQERGLRLEITSGLQQGDMLVSEGAQQLSADAKLNIVPALITPEALAMVGR
jgi:RND family efflux transporter MFP subunit